MESDLKAARPLGSGSNESRKHQPHDSPLLLSTPFQLLQLNRRQLSGRRTIQVMHINSTARPIAIRRVFFGLAAFSLLAFGELRLLSSKARSITDEENRANGRAGNFVPPRVEAGKRIPGNALKLAYTAQMAASDQTLADIFGGPRAVAAANGFEPQRLGPQYPLYRGDFISEDGKVRRGHLSYAMHLYGSEDGTADTQIYIPAGFTSHSSQPTPTDAAITFYYPRLGRLRNVTLAIFHVADFRLIHEGDRVRIGKIGGRGGSLASYRHSHLEFYRGDTKLPSGAARVGLRIDPATVFAATTARINMARNKTIR